MPGNFEQLWQESHECVCRGLVRAGAHRADAEDAVSEATIRAMNAFSRYDPGRASFTTWLSIIAYREWLRLLGRQRRFVRLDPDRELAGDEGIEDSMLRVRNESEAEGESEVEKESEIRKESEIEKRSEMQVRERVLRWVTDREAGGPAPGRKYGVVVDELLKRSQDGGSLRQVDLAKALGVNRSTVCRAYAWLREMVEEMREGDIRSEREDAR